MSVAANFPLFCVVLSFLCAAVSPLLRPKAAGYLTCALAAVCAALSGFVLAFCLKNGPVVYPLGHVPHPWGNELSFGVLEPLVCTVFSLVLL